MTREFSIENLPYGVFSVGSDAPRCGIAYEDSILDLKNVEDLNDLVPPGTFAQTTLNAYADLGPETWARVRERVTEIVGTGASKDLLIPQAAATMHLPVRVPDYVDFYSSIQHATNLGRIFRPDGDPLLPNWRHLPVGYHGRASTIVVSGTPITRPCGQRMEPGAAGPSFGPSTRLDFELEIGFITAVPNLLGTPIGVSNAEEHIFGLVLVNDWSARDVQAWEYQPLGPFLGKSFATSISPWVVPLAALTAFRVPPAPQDPEPLPYLRGGPNHAQLDIGLQIEINDTVISRTNARNLYWTMAQQLAHATVNGAVASTGDLFASGTISGSEPGTYGSMIELSWNGANPVDIGGGEMRTFLEDGDTVRIRGVAGGNPAPGATEVGFGEVVGTVTPALLQ